MRCSFLALWAVVTQTLVTASPACHTFGNCDACASAQTWVGHDHCRYCTEDKECHAEGSWFNPCSSSEDVTDASKCQHHPVPKPVPTPSVENNFAKAVLTFLFKHLKITDVDPATCVSDVGGAFVLFKEFEGDLRVKNYGVAASHLGRGISALANSIAGCGVPEVQQKLDVLAASIRWANISTASLDKTVKVIVGARDLWDDFTALAAAIKSRDPSAVGDKLSTLLDNWTSIVGGCSADNKACKLMDGLLRVVAEIAKDEAGCQAALAPALVKFVAGANDFKAKNYTSGVANYASGLDLVAQATSGDSCHLKGIADAIGKLGPKLAAAVVKVESSGAVKIIVGSADVYHELYSATVDLEKGDYAGVGIQLGALLSQLRASGCSNQACIVMEGILASLQEGFTDFEACKGDVEKSWSKIQSFISLLEKKQWPQAITALGDIFGDLSASISACGVKKIGDVLSDTAKRLHADSISTAIASVTQVLVSGGDVMPDLQKIIADSQSGNWESLGRDLGSLGDWLTGTGCKSFVCKLVEGILDEADKTLVDLKPCEATLRHAEDEFTAGAALWGKGQPETAIKYWASGLNQLAKGVKDCDLEDHLKFIEQEANVFGLGNVTFLEDAVQVIVHGADFYQALYAAVEDIMNHDYRSAGSHMATVMNDLSEWTTHHLCTSDICYVVSGVFQYLADLKNDIKTCGNDFKTAYGNFTLAAQDLVEMKPQFHFSTNKTQVRAGVRHIGEGLKVIADAVGDCHMVELAAIIEKLAVELGIVPEVKWVETLIKILIKAVPIERELSNALEDWSDENWPGFGYNIIKLIKTLLTASDRVVKSAPKAMYI